MISEPNIDNSDRNTSDKKDVDCNFDNKEPDILSTIYDLLKGHKEKEVLNFIKNASVRSYFEDNSLDVVPILTHIIDEDFCNEDTTRCIENLLITIASVANIKEVLLVFLEEVEIFRSQIHFRVLIKPIQTVLFREVSVYAKFSLFSWVFNILYAHVHVLPLPSARTLEGEERKLLACDEKLINLSETLIPLSEFYTDIFKELTAGNLKWPKLNSNEYFAQYLLKYFDKPFAYLDIYINDADAEYNMPVPEIYSLCLKFVYMITSLIRNPFKLLIYIKPKLLHKVSDDESSHDEFTEEDKSDEDNTTEDIECRAVDDKKMESLSQISLGTFFYCILGQGMSAATLPHIYAADYLYLSLLPCYVHLLCNKETLTIHKGLLLMKHLLGNISQGMLPSVTLDAPNHFEAMQSLVRVMTSCENKDCRLIALQCFKTFLWKFDIPGRIKLMTTILTTVNHPGIHGVVIHELKENLDKYLRNSYAKELVNENFCDSKFHKLLELVWSLPEAERTDLLEWSDKIMSALNLIIYLYIRDKNNITKFENCQNNLKKNFLQPLEDGLRISRAHYELKLKDIISHDRSENKCEVSVNIGDSILPNLPVEQERQVILTALNWFDMMRSVLARCNNLIG